MLEISNTDKLVKIDKNSDKGEKKSVKWKPVAGRDKFKSAVCLPAPFAIWDALHEDVCEEASMMMLDAYKENWFYQTRNGRWNPESSGLGKISFFWKTQPWIKPWRFYKSIWFGHCWASDITVEDIKKVAAGRPRWCRRREKELKFSWRRPRYHMILIKGYTKDGYFITNDPHQTRRWLYL